MANQRLKDIFDRHQSEVMELVEHFISQNRLYPAFDALLDLKKLDIRWDWETLAQPYKKEVLEIMRRQMENLNTQLVYSDIVVMKNLGITWPELSELADAIRDGKKRR